MGFEVTTSVNSTRHSRIKPLTKIWNHLRLKTPTALHLFPCLGSQFRNITCFSQCPSTAARQRCTFSNAEPGPYASCSRSSLTRTRCATSGVAEALTAGTAISSSTSERRVENGGERYGKPEVEE